MKKVERDGMKVTLSVSIPIEVALVVKQKAAQQGRSVPDYIRSIIEKEITK